MVKLSEVLASIIAHLGIADPNGLLSGHVDTLSAHEDALELRIKAIETNLNHATGFDPNSEVVNREAAQETRLSNVEARINTLTDKVDSLDITDLDTTGMVTLMPGTVVPPLGDTTTAKVIDPTQPPLNQSDVTNLPKVDVVPVP